MPCSVINASPKAGGGGGGGDDEEVLMKHRLQFTDSLKDLKNLRKQLYSAAEYFESSYNRDNHKQFVVESSKDYVAKALVNTVDHLGSVADKLNKFMDQNANQLSTTNTQFSSIQQRLCTAKGLVHSRCLSQHLLHTEDTANLKHTILPAAETLPLALGKSNVLYGNRFSSLRVRDDVNQPKQEKTFCKSFEAGRMKADPALAVTRKQVSREASLNPLLSFSFTNKEGAERRSVSPLALRFNLTTKRSVSPNPSLNKGQRPTEPRRAISACRGREMRNREMEMESYTKKSKHLLKALLSLHHSRKSNSTQTHTGIAYY